MLTNYRKSLAKQSLGLVSLWPTVTRAKGRVEPQNGGKVSNGKGYKSSSIHYINLTNISVQVVFPTLII